MDRKGKRLAALLCAVLMAVTLLPGQVWAEMYSAEDAPLSATVVCSNPLYPELGVTESVTYDAPGTAMLAETNAMGDGGRYDSLTDVAAYVHQQFKAREQILFFYTGYPADGPFSELTAEEAAAAYSKSEKQLAADGVSHAGILLRRRFAKYLTTLVRQLLLPEVFRLRGTCEQACGIAGLCPAAVPAGAGGGGGRPRGVGQRQRRIPRLGSGQAGGTMVSGRRRVGRGSAGASPLPESQSQ